MNRFARAAAVGLVTAAALITGPATGHAAARYSSFHDSKCGVGFDLPRGWSTKKDRNGYQFASSQAIVLNTECFNLGVSKVGPIYEGSLKHEGFSVTGRTAKSDFYIVYSRGAISKVAYEGDVVILKMSASRSYVFQFLVPKSLYKGFSSEESHIVGSAH